MSNDTFLEVDELLFPGFHFTNCPADINETDIMKTYRLIKSAFRRKDSIKAIIFKALNFILLSSYKVYFMHCLDNLKRCNFFFFLFPCDLLTLISYYYSFVLFTLIS